MIRVFYTVLPAVTPKEPSDDRRSNASGLHDAAWKLLAAALHREDPVRFPSSDPAALPDVIREEHGKPRFADKDLPQFSLSHSGDVAACAIDDDHPVGIDIQRFETRIRMEGVSRRFFHPREQEYLRSLSGEEEKRQAFFRIFSCKEAYSKCTGLGLAAGFTGFCADPEHSVILGGADDRIICHLYADMLRPEPGSALYALAVCRPEPFKTEAPVRISL